MLYTTYLAKIDDIDDSIPKLIITRFPPTWIKNKKSKRIVIAKPLSPSKKILFDYKNNDNWDMYVKRFMKQIKTNPTKRYIKDVVSYLKKDNDLVLLCFEKDYTKCHRYLLVKYIKEKYNITWEEINYE